MEATRDREVLVMVDTPHTDEARWLAHLLFRACKLIVVEIANRHGFDVLTRAERAQLRRELRAELEAERRRG